MPLSTISGLAQDCSIQHQNKCGICPWPKMSEHAGFQFIFINIQESKSVQIKFLSMVKTMSVHFIPIFHTKTCPNSTFTVSSCTARNLGRSMLRCIECAFKALEVLTGSILRLHSSRIVRYTQLSSVCCDCQCPWKPVSTAVMVLSVSQDSVYCRRNCWKILLIPRLTMALPLPNPGNFYVCALDCESQTMPTAAKPHKKISWQNGT